MAVTLSMFRAQFNTPLRQGLIETIEHTSVILPLMNFITIDDLSYEYKERTALPGVAFRGLNEDYVAAPGAYNRKSEPLVMFGGQVKTDTQLANKRGGQARTNELLGSVKSAGLFFDRNFFTGDTGTDPKAFDGLRVRLANDQVITAGDNGAYPSIDQYVQLLDAVRGDNTGKTLFMTKQERRRLSGEVVAAAGGAAVLDVGKQLMEFQGAKIQVVEEDHQGNAILPYDEVQGTDSTTTSSYCVRFGSSIDEEDVQGLLGSTFMNVKYVGDFGTYLLDVLDNNIGLAVFNGRSAARLKGVKRPAA